MQVEQEELKAREAQEDVPDQLIGVVLGGRYEIRRPIGKGGMGVVYLAHQGNLDREVVVKVLGKGLSDQGEALQRFEREALGLSKLTHPNIVTIHDFGQDHDQAYIVMEYVNGEMLSDLLARSSRMGLELFASIAAQILAALSEAHGQGIIHRDIKPSNIMLCERHGSPNFVKVLDFGLVKLVGEAVEVTKKQNLVGSVSFLAPEQILGLEFDQRADVYALGVLFYYMLSGQKPFIGEDDIAILYQHIHKDAPDLREVLPEGHDIPEDLIVLVERCLAKEPEERPADAQAVLDALNLASGQGEVRLPWVSGEFNAISRDSLRFSSEVSVVEEGDSSVQLPTLAQESSGRYAPLRNTEQTSVLSAEQSEPVQQEPVVEVATEGDRKNTAVMLVVAAVLFVLITAGAALMFMGPREGGSSGDAGPGVMKGWGPAEQEVLIQVDELLGDEKWGQAESLIATLKGQARPSGALVEIAKREESLRVGRLLQKGRMAQESGDLEDAKKAYEEVLLIVPSHEIARQGLKESDALLHQAVATMSSLKVVSEPVGARVFVDGMDMGVAPLSLELEQGAYAISLRLPGYQEAVQSVELKRDEAEVVRVELIKAKSQKDVASSKRVKPPKASGDDVKRERTKDASSSAKQGKAGAEDLLMPVEKPKDNTLDLDEDGLLPVGE